MNYYPFHVGDYISATAHLDPLEDIAYRRLLDLYYLREAPIEGRPDQLARVIRMRDHVAIVEAVLGEFFAEHDTGGDNQASVWTHSRCDAELDRMREKQVRARTSGLASASARAQRGRNAAPAPVAIPSDDPATDDERSGNERSTNVQRTLNERSTTVQPEINGSATTNTNTNTNTNTKRTPNPKGARARAVAVAVPEWVPADAWQGFAAMRQRIRAPLTDRAVALTVRELDLLRADGHDPAAVLDQSTAKAWRGVFPIKAPGGPAGFNPRTEQLARHNAAVVDTLLREDGLLP